MFSPHLLPIARGLLTACYFSAGGAGDQIGSRLERAYAREPFVRVLAPGTWPEPRNVRGTNLVEIGFGYDATAGVAVVMSAIDNLGKGAGGQAVQNFNCMFGFEETTALDLVAALP
jgi:N-acetyl-gamma-glutamyl-phosphate reductase